MSVDPSRATCPGAASCPAAREASPTGRPALTWRRVGAERDLPAGGLKTFSADGVSVLVLRAGGELVAVQSLCPHEGVPLEDGVVEGTTLTCLEHMWQFDVKSGAPLGEATEGLRTFAVRSDDGELYVALE